MKDFEKKLKEIELALLQEDYEQADLIYEELLLHWQDYEKSLKEKEKTENCLRILEFLANLLDNKRRELLSLQKSMQVRGVYSLRSIK